MHTFSYICNRYKIQIYIYKLLWFRTGHQSAFRESFGSERGIKVRFASHLVQNGALQSAFSRVIWFRTGFKAFQNTVFKIYMDLNPNICICIHFHTYVIDIKYKFTYINYFGSERGIKARFASHLIQNGIQSAFRESFDSKRGFKARLVSHLNQNEASKRVSRVIWFRTGLFKARFASHLVQNGDSKRVSRVIWFKRGFKARFASHLIQNGASKRVSRIIWFKTGFRCWIKWLTKRTLKPRFGFLGHQSSGHTRK